MNDEKLLWLKYHPTTNVVLYHNCLQLAFKEELKNENYSESEIMNKVNNYGQKLYEAINYEVLNDETLEKYKNNVLNIFVEFYKEVGYYKNNKDFILENKSLILINYNNIATNAKSLINFYLLYNLYNISNSNISTRELKEAIKYLKSLNKTVDETILPEDLNSIIFDFIEVAFRAKQLLLTFKIKKENNIILFDIMSYDIVSLAFYSLKDTILLTDIHSANTFVCKICKKEYIKKGHNQKYCTNCSKKVNYNSHLDKNKIDLITKTIALPNVNEIENLKELLTNSRKRLSTRLREIENIYKKYSQN